MNTQNSGYSSLHRIFRDNIRAREIAEYLVSVDKEQPLEEVVEFMELKDYDVIGVREGGAVVGYILREDCKSGQISDHLIKFSDEDLLREGATLFDALNVLKTRRWTFIQYLDNPSGIITRGDLQKAPVRLWLFGVISLLEMQLLRLIRRQYPEDAWEIYLSEKRIEAAGKVFTDRVRENDGIDMAECLQIGDKKAIFKKSEILFSFTGLQSKGAWEAFMKELEKLRNMLAHSNSIPSSSWPEITRLALQIESCLSHLEKQ